MAGSSARETREVRETREAREAATAAAARARVVIRPAHTLAEVQTARRVVDAVWQPSPEDPAVTESLLWPIVHAGNYCAIAYDAGGDTASGDGEPVGVCVAFLGFEPAGALHSHVTGVTAAGAGRNLGFALKQDQRAWALEHGLTTVTWTYDPLVRRNAFFNLTRLGARPVDYLVDFYGQMTDRINRGQGSDRLVVTWDLTSDGVVRCASRGDAEPKPDLSRDALPGNDVRFVEVPEDIERMRAEQPEEARRWRLAVRAELGGLMADGWSVVAMSRDGRYELRRTT